jgi:uridine kinase
MSTADAMARLPFPPLMLAVAGASGSGKTTLAAELARALGGLHFSLDTYYRDLSHLPLEKRRLVNFDDPAMIEVPLLARHIAELAQGRAIERPVYSYSEYIRIPEETETLRPVLWWWSRGCLRRIFLSCGLFTSSACMSIQRTMCALRAA